MLFPDPFRFWFAFTPNFFLCICWLAKKRSAVNHHQKAEKVAKKQTDHMEIHKQIFQLPLSFGQTLWAMGYTRKNTYSLPESL